MKMLFFFISVLCIFFTIFFVTGLICDEMILLSYALEKPLKTEPANFSDITGEFTLILYGSRFSDDLETVAILDLEGDQYHFEPYAPDFDYKIKKGYSAKEAIEHSRKFVSFHYSFHKFFLNRIIDANGKTIGFEFRPLYYPLSYGKSDVLEVYYWLKKGGKVKVTIQLIPEVERLRFPGDGGDGTGGD